MLGDRNNVLSSVARCQCGISAVPTITRFAKCSRSSWHLVPSRRQSRDDDGAHPDQSASTLPPKWHLQARLLVRLSLDFTANYYYSMRNSRKA
jgi:hypothetical protein